MRCPVCHDGYCPGCDLDDDLDEPDYDDEPLPPEIDDRTIGPVGPTGMSVR